MRVLADSSVWIEALRNRASATARGMAAMLGRKQIVTSVDVAGELAMGTLAERARFLANLAEMPQIPRGGACTRGRSVRGGVAPRLELERRRAHAPEPRGASAPDELPHHPRGS